VVDDFNTDGATNIAINAGTTPAGATACPSSLMAPDRRRPFYRRPEEGATLVEFALVAPVS